MSELLRVGIFAAISAAITAALIAWFNGPVWYAIGPLVVFTAYAIKLTVKKRRDEPRVVMAVLFVVSLAMVVFAWFNRSASI
jgi:cytochrome bd-type quinol oxidase subunit 2